MFGANEYGTNFRAPQVDIHKFSMIPRANIPRSAFKMQSQHKTTFSASYLIPVACWEVLPGDSWKIHMAAFCRLSTPLFPIMDNMDLESWFFFTPCRILWSHWTNFQGEQPATPTDSIAYTIPQVVSAAGGFGNFSLFDYFGIPGVGQVGGSNVVAVNVLPFRAYNLTWNQWFRDQNLQNGAPTGASGVVGDIGDGPDLIANYTVQQVGKRHDYFTSCLPWTQKGGTPISIFATGNSATVKTQSTEVFTGNNTPAYWRTTTNAPLPANLAIVSPTTAVSPSALNTGTTAGAGANVQIYPTNLFADLSTANTTTINQLRLAFQTQKLLERDARGGTRYQEMLMAHWGVRPPDYRVQKPEYIGGGRNRVNMAPVPQTTATGLTGGSTPIGALAGVGTVVGAEHGARYSATEHGYIIGLVAVRADPVYQQGLHRMWTRQTRYDFYMPVFAALGEQAVLNGEIYCQGSAADNNVFGYQEHWSEYRYMPSRTSAFFRSTTATPLDAWHLAEKFTALPALNSAFINDKTGTTLARNLAAGASAGNQQFLCDFYFDCTVARAMPLYSVPGLIDHF